MREKTARINYFGIPWVGNFVSANNELAFIPSESSQGFERMVSTTLSVETIRATACSSPLLGSYIAMNSNGIILPRQIEEREYEHMKKTGLNICVCSSVHNSNGSNISANDNGAVCNPKLERKEMDNISDCLGVEVVPSKVWEYFTVGSCILANNKGFLIHFKAREEDIKHISSVLKVPGKRGSINLGSGFVGVGAVCNDKGCITGRETTAFELGAIEEALDYIG